MTAVFHDGSFLMRPMAVSVQRELLPAAAWRSKQQHVNYCLFGTSVSSHQHSVAMYRWYFDPKGSFALIVWQLVAAAAVASKLLSTW